MKKVFIVEALRTPVGSFLGSLKDYHPALMGGELVKEIMKRNNLSSECIDEVIIGNILPASLGQGVGRQVAIYGGLDVDTCAYSLNMACGSGMKALMNARANIVAGFSSMVIVGGVENMSLAPFLSPSLRSGKKMGDLVFKDHMLFDALTDAFNNVHMGVTAENIALKYDISREDQDLFAFNSQNKALKAIDSDVFKSEIVPLVIKSKKGDFVFENDEFVNRKTSLDVLSKLRPVFKNDGSVTAGNASGINDGASMLLVCGSDELDKYDLKPMVEVIGMGQGGVDPLLMGMGPVKAILRALESCDLTLSDVGLLELNEAFAAQSLGVLNDLSLKSNIDFEDLLKITNVNGGAIALGHAVGSSGSRIVVTLAHEMKRRDVLYGVASLCIGGGMGVAVVLKLCK